MKPLFDVPDCEVTLKYEIDPDEGDFRWVFTDKEGKIIFLSEQPDFKAVFQAGYDYATEQHRRLLR